MKKIIYFSDLVDAARHAQALAAQGYACFTDQPGDFKGFQPVPPLDSDTTEQAVGFLFDRLKSAGEFEAAIIHAQLFTHYPRLFRCQAAFSKSGSDKVGYFIPKEKMGVYDLAFSFDGPCDFENLVGSEIQKSEIHGLVEFYGPSAQNASVAPLKVEASETIQSNENLPTRIFFIAHDNENNLYLRSLISIFKELDARGVPYTVLGCDGRASKFLKQEGIAFTELAGLCPSPGEAEGAAMAAWFAGEVNHHRPESGDGLYDELQRWACNSAVRRDLWETRRLSLALLAHLEQGGFTDVFFVPDGTPIAAGLHAALKKAGIRLHTFVASGISLYKRAVGYYFSESFYCAGHDAAESIAFHFPDRRVFPMGSPVLERYLTQERHALPDDGRANVLIATSGYDPAEAVWMEALARRIDPATHRLILKPHPSYPDRYAGLVDAFNAHLLVPSTASIEGLVNAADVVITDHSQVGIDAHLLGKPVVSMYAGPGDILYMKNIDSIKYVRVVDDLLAEIKKPQKGGGPPVVSENFINSFNSHGDRYYFRRIVDHLLKLNQSIIK